MAAVAFTMPDVRFVFPDSTILFAHKSILRHNCTYFKDLFSGGFAESETNKSARQSLNLGMNAGNESLSEVKDELAGTVTEQSNNILATHTGVGASEMSVVNITDFE